MKVYKNLVYASEICILKTAWKLHLAAATNHLFTTQWESRILRFYAYCFPQNGMGWPNAVTGMLSATSTCVTENSIIYKYIYVIIAIAELFWNKIEDDSLTFLTPIKSFKSWIHIHNDKNKEFKTWM